MSKSENTECHVRYSDGKDGTDLTSPYHYKSLLIKGLPSLQKVHTHLIWSSIQAHIIHLTHILLRFGDYSQTATFHYFNTAQ